MKARALALDAGRIDLAVMLAKQTRLSQHTEAIPGAGLRPFARWIDILVFAFAGHSFSDIERDVQRFRRAVALGTTTDADLVEDFMKARALALDRQAASIWR